jgi:hypothetical protein
MALNSTTAVGLGCPQGQRLEQVSSVKEGYLPLGAKVCTSNTASRTLNLFLEKLAA